LGELLGRGWLNFATAIIHYYLRDGLRKKKGKEKKKSCPHNVNWYPVLKPSLHHFSQSDEEEIFFYVMLITIYYIISF